MNKAKTKTTATTRGLTRDRDIEELRRQKRRELDRRAFAYIREALNAAEALLRQPGMHKRHARIDRVDFARARSAADSAEAWLQISDSPELQSMFGIDRAGAECAAGRQTRIGLYHLNQLRRRHDSINP
jgi:hypothetical protein